MSGTASISGIVSGLKTDEILEKLQTLAKLPIARLNMRKATYAAKLSAWQSINSRLLSLKEKAGALASHTVFSAVKATSSNESLVKATVAGSVPAGEYSFTVNTLATAHKVISQGYANETTLVGSGTFSIATGIGAAVDIQTDGMTLADLRDSINKGNTGVTAFIMNDGTAAPCRLVLASKATGTAGQITTTANLAGGTSPTFTDLKVASDASISLGDGVTVTRSSNTITGVIPGLTLDLQNADPNQTVNVTVTADTESIKQKVRDFVSQYNDIVGFLGSQWKFDSKTEESGLLIGDFSVARIQDELAEAIGNPVVGLSSSMSLLSQAGVRLGNDGKLKLDETVLDKALKDDYTGVTKLFSRYGETTNTAVRFIGATGDTKASGVGGYAVEITQIAAQSRITAGSAQSGALAADETLTINGVAITLQAGMTQDQIIAKINSSNAKVLASMTGADGTGSGTYLTLTSTAYGSNAKITAISSQSNGTTGSTGLGNVVVTESAPAGEGNAGTGAKGTDVAGTINGEAATGAGQMLTGSTGDSKGLSLLIRATTVGALGTVSYTEGISANLNDTLAFLTESDKSLVKSTQTSLQETIDEISESITATERSVLREQDRLQAQFNAMETALARLQSQGSYIASQVGTLSKNWKTS